MEPLGICHDGIDVGRALPAGNRFALEYDSGWRRLEFAFPLSRTLPLRDGRYSPDDAHSFFANLLPEGLSRQAICKRLGISVDNDVELLRALGDDTAGAFTFVSGDGPPERTPRQRVTDEMLHDWSGGEPPIPEERPVRLSIATGRLPTQKYEREGGPGFAGVADIIRFESSSPAEDLLRLVRWAIFCALAPISSLGQNARQPRKRGNNATPHEMGTCARCWLVDGLRRESS